MNTNEPVFIGSQEFTGLANEMKAKIEKIVNEQQGEILESVPMAAPLAAELQTPGLAEDTEELS